jgi:tetratricopeptide (TPR) repeat protein
MAIRKEQVLLLVAGAIAVLVWRAGQDEIARVRYAPKTRDYTPRPVASAPLAPPAPAVPANAPLPRPWFREPSETQPLPPCELPFPQLEPLPIIALPLDIGPDLAHAELLRIPGDVVEGVTLPGAAQGGASAGGADASGDKAPDKTTSDKPAGDKPAGDKPADKTGDTQGQPTRAQLMEKWSHVYDQLLVVGQTTPMLGTIKVNGVDPFDLEDPNFDFSTVHVEFKQFSLKTESLGNVPTVFPDNGQQIKSVKLANNLKNEVTRRVRKIPRNMPCIPERLSTIDWLLLKGREDGKVYDAALQQVDLLEQHGAKLEAMRTRARVLRARADLAQELAVYQSAQGDANFDAFKHEGLGLFNARLGLWDDAERDLRLAVADMPTDARLHASLANFLRERGRGKEALKAAQKASEALGAVTGDLDRQRVIAIIVACQLGQGMVTEARTSLAQLPEDSPIGSYLRACVDYAGGDVATAKEQFGLAASGLEPEAATLGLGACQVRQAAWQEALATFESVADRAPLLRHRAQTGIALVWLRIGQFDNALTAIDRALEASPQDAYAFYLRGRTLRILRQLGPAQEALQQALRLRDDFTAALAEMAAVREQMAREAAAAEQPENALAAQRYSDRAVALSSLPLVALFLRQAIAHFQAADPKGAAAAFERARAQALQDKNDADSARLAQAGLAVVDYSQEHSEEAKDTLANLLQDLASQKDHPLRKWVERTRQRIDDHEKKEQLEDHFERDLPGSIWLAKGENNGVQVGLKDHAVAFGGAFARSGEVSIVRTGAVAKAKNFLGVSARIQLGAQCQGDAGLRIQSKMGGGGSGDFVAWIGFRDGRPTVFLQDGKDEQPQPVIKVADGTPTTPHKVELRVVPREEGGRQFRLLCVWDGNVVHEADLKLITGSTTVELETGFFVKGGSKNTPVDARFDDFHLERCKD